MVMNILNEEGKKKFVNNFFTENGYDTLVNYGKTLTKLYFTRNEYPFRIGIVFGLPFFSFSNEVISKEELIGRIKLIMMLTGQEEIKIKLGDSDMSFNFGLKNPKNINKGDL